MGDDADHVERTGTEPVRAPEVAPAGMLFALGTSRPPPRQFASRHTGAGYWYQDVVGLALARAEYTVEPQQTVGRRLEATGHVVDFVVRDPGRALLVSAKWQARAKKGRGPGSGEDKLAYEVLTLGAVLHARPEDFQQAYVVLGGMGFGPAKLQWFLDGRYRGEIQHTDQVVCVRTDEFLDRAFRHTL